MRIQFPRSAPRPIIVPPPPPPEAPPSKLRYFDLFFVLLLVFSVWHQTPIGSIPSYLATLAKTGSPALTADQRQQPRNWGPLQFPEATQLSHPLPTNLQKAAAHLNMEPSFLNTVAYTLGSCDLEDCRIPAPPHLYEILGNFPTAPIVPIYTLAKGLKAASDQLHQNPELGLEALFLGVGTVRRALHFAKIAGHPQPTTIEGHSSFFPSQVPSGTIATLRSVLANQRLWNLHWPVSDVHRISSKFGHRTHPVTHQTHLHNGIDIAAPTGTPVLAAQTGLVVRVGRDSLNGNYVKINHGYGIQTVYCHLDSILTSNGAQVLRGVPIGTVGSTGRVTGPHLHFTLKLNNKATDPQNYPWLNHSPPAKISLIP